MEKIVKVERGCYGGPCACSGACRELIPTTERGAIFHKMALILMARTYEPPTA